MSIVAQPDNQAALQTPMTDEERRAEARDITREVEQDRIETEARTLRAETHAARAERLRKLIPDAAGALIEAAACGCNPDSDPAATLHVCRLLAREDGWHAADPANKDAIVTEICRAHRGQLADSTVRAVLGRLDLRTLRWVDPPTDDAEDEIPWAPVSEVTTDHAWAAHASGVAFPGRMTLFSGHRKAGKSTLIAAVAAAIAGGADWLSGEEVDAGGAIWFGGAGESTPADVQLMTADAGASPAALARIQFARVMRSDRMAAALAEHAPDDLRLVVIDSGRSLITADGGKENDADSIRLSLGRIAAWQAEHGQDVAVVLIHHFKKDLDIPVGHRFRGSGDWGAVVDVIVEYDRTDDGAKLSYEGRRGSPVDPLHLAWNHHGYTATSTPADNPPSSASGRIAKIDAAIQTYLEEHPEGVSGHAVRQAIAGRVKVVIQRLKAIGVQREDGLWVGCSAPAKPAPPEQAEQPVPEPVPEVVPPLFPRQHGTSGTGVVPEVVPVVPAPIGEQPIGNNPPAVPEAVPEETEETKMSENLKTIDGGIVVEADAQPDLVLARIVGEMTDALDDHPLALPACLGIYTEGMLPGIEPTDVEVTGEMLAALWDVPGSRSEWLAQARAAIRDWAQECETVTEHADGTTTTEPMEAAA